MGQLYGWQAAFVLALPLASLAVVLLTQGLLMHRPVTAVLSLLLMGGSAFVVVLLLQTWLMRELGPVAGILLLAGMIGALAIRHAAQPDRQQRVERTERLGGASIDTLGSLLRIRSTSSTWR